MGDRGAIAGVWLYRRLLADSSYGAEWLVPPPGAVLSEHLSYGRWAIMTNVLMWVPLNFFIMFSGWIDIEASATLRLANLLLPLLQTNAALSALLVPAMVARTGGLHGQLRNLLLLALALLNPPAGFTICS